jgi:hypothetical protein
LGNGKLTLYLQDRPQRVLEEAGRHHRAGEAIRCQGHQREGEGHDGGLGGGQQSWGNFFLCFGASQAVSGKGLLFVCDCLAPTRASEYNCSLLRHGQTGSSSSSRPRPRPAGFSLGVTRAVFPGLSGNESMDRMRDGTSVTGDGQCGRDDESEEYPRFVRICVMGTDLNTVVGIPRGSSSCGLMECNSHLLGRDAIPIRVSAPRTASRHFWWGFSIHQTTILGVLAPDNALLPPSASR